MMHAFGTCHAQSYTHAYKHATFSTRLKRATCKVREKAGYAPLPPKASNHWMDCKSGWLCHCTLPGNEHRMWQKVAEWSYLHS